MKLFTFFLCLLTYLSAADTQPPKSEFILPAQPQAPRDIKFRNHTMIKGTIQFYVPAVIVILKADGTTIRVDPELLAASELALFPDSAPDRLLKSNAQVNALQKKIELIEATKLADSLASVPATPAPPAKVEPPLPDKPAPEGKLSIGNIALRSTEVSDEYVHYAWTVTVVNKTSEAQRVLPQLSLLDKQEFLLEDDLGDASIIPAGKTVVLSSKSLMRRQLWDQVVTYSVKLR